MGSGPSLGVKLCWPPWPKSWICTCLKAPIVRVFPFGAQDWKCTSSKMSWADLLRLVSLAVGPRHFPHWASCTISGLGNVVYWKPDSLVGQPTPLLTPSKIKSVTKLTCAVVSHTANLRLTSNKTETVLTWLWTFVLLPGTQHCVTAANVKLQCKCNNWRFYVSRLYCFQLGVVLIIWQMFWVHSTTIYFVARKKANLLDVQTPSQGIFC